MTWKGAMANIPQVLMPRASKGNGGQKTGKDLGETECVTPDAGPKKNAPVEGRLFGRLMAESQGLLCELLAFSARILFNPLRHPLLRQ